MGGMNCERKKTDNSKLEGKLICYKGMHFKYCWSWQSCG